MIQQLPLFNVTAAYCMAVSAALTSCKTIVYVNFGGNLCLLGASLIILKQMCNLYAWGYTYRKCLSGCLLSDKSGQYGNPVWPGEYDVVYSYAITTINRSYYNQMQVYEVEMGNCGQSCKVTWQSTWKNERSELKDASSPVTLTHICGLLVKGLMTSCSCRVCLSVCLSVTDVAVNMDTCTVCMVFPVIAM